ncbi:class I SAM-dependent methyltransferase [Cohnella luojiensis]|uniref:Class I SAM-dependent methyltransferase n=2 Tax=Cohnella luojiensis TaxID=652876 RepID=A0A4Y8LXG6_9BACL|nr:class I SAM-dependent methyltransferase [Cohnella luojiensis]
MSFSLVAILLLALASIVHRSWMNGISPMPSSAPVRRAVVAEIHRLSEKGLIVEAGSGWGTLGIHIGRYCRGWRLVGIENSTLPLGISKILAWLTFGVQARRDSSDSSRTSVSFQRGDIYRYSYSEASMVVCYLYPEAMNRLSPMLQQQLRSDAFVISVCFALPGWQPERVITCGDLYRTKVYVYSAQPRRIEK